MPRRRPLTNQLCRVTDFAARRARLCKRSELMACHLDGSGCLLVQDREC